MMYDIERGIGIWITLRIDAMRDDVGEMIVRCGVNEVGVAVGRWGHVHEWVDLGS
jgi:hypothetical protein